MAKKKQDIDGLKSNSFWNTPLLVKVLKEENYEEKRTFRFRPISALSLFLSFFLLTILGTALIIFYTSVRVLIPGYPDSEFRRTILENSMALDSLEQELAMRDEYIQLVKNLIKGETDYEITDTIYVENSYENIDFSISPDDSLLRLSVERDDFYSLNRSGDRGVKTDLRLIHFFPPVKGIITNSFDISRNHFGTDIVTSPQEIVLSTLTGTVVSADWSMDFGYTIQIQHENNLMSVYKHNSELFKNSGERVKAGEAIATVGNSGLLSTGPHLHFEIWYKGVPLNAEEYISF